MFLLRAPELLEVLHELVRVDGRVLPAGGSAHLGGEEDVRAVTSRCIVYVHYDADGRVDRYVYRALESLRPYADRIVVVSNSPVSQEDRDRLSGLTDDLLVRANEALDVGAHREALAYLGPAVSGYDEVIFANDTWFGPIGSWEAVFGRTATWDEVDFWGLTEHKEVSPHPFAPERTLPRHLTSHWIAVRHRLLVSEDFRRFWEEMPPVHTYRDAVRWYETALTPYFEQRGYVGRALFPADRYRGANPSLQDAMALLKDGCPVLKRRAVFHSRFELGQRPFDPVELRELVQERGYDIDLILSSAARSTSPRRLIASMGLTEIVDSEAPVRGGSSSEASGCTGALLAGVCDCEDPDVVRQHLRCASAGTVEIVRYHCQPGTAEDRPARRAVADSARRHASCGFGYAVQAVAPQLDGVRSDSQVLILPCQGVGVEETSPQYARAAAAAGTVQWRDARWSGVHALVQARGRFDTFSSLGAVVLADLDSVAAARGGAGSEDSAGSQMDAGVRRDADAPLGLPYGVALVRVQALREMSERRRLATGEHKPVPSDERVLEEIHHGGWHIRQVLDHRDAAVLFSEYEYELMSLYRAYRGPQGRLLAYLRASSLPGGESAAHLRTLLDVWFPAVGDSLKPAFRRARAVVDGARSRVRAPGVRR